jgi:hypothetical protein
LKQFNKDWGNKAIMPKAVGELVITEEVAKIMTKAAFKAEKWRIGFL